MERKNAFKKLCMLGAGGTALFLMGWGTWLFIGMFQKATPNVKVSILGLIGVVVVASIGHFLTKKREIDARHFSEKRDAYGQMIDVTLGTLNPIVPKTPPLPPTELAKKLFKCKQDLTIWSSPEVVHAWN